MRVLITGARAPVALHLARLLHGAGCHVVLADSLARTISSATVCAEYALLPRPVDGIAAYGAAVRRLVAAHRIEIVVPTCEEVFHLARAGVAMFAPGLELLARAHHKFEFVELARGLGLPVPETRLLACASDLEGLPEGLVYKPVWSRFATGVRMGPEGVRPTAEAPWVAQAYLPGEELSAYAYAHEGAVCGLSAYRSKYRAGRGAGVWFEPVDAPEIADFVERFVAGTGWHGQVSFDFRRGASGELMAIECNPRAVSGVHFFRDAASFAGAFFGGERVVPDVTRPQMVAAAMLAYGGRRLTSPAFWRDYGRAEALLDWPGDPGPKRQQWAALREIAGVAWRERCGLRAASTFDIEWNGEGGLV